LLRSAPGDTLSPDSFHRELEMSTETAGAEQFSPLSASERGLAEMWETDRIGLLASMREIIAQNDLRALVNPASTEAPRLIIETIMAAPHAYWPTEVSVPAARLLADPSPPRGLISWWRAVFSGYHRNPSNDPPAKTVYVPLVDIRVSGPAASRLTSSASCTNTTGRSATIKLQAKGIGLVQRVSETVTLSATYPAAVGTNQISCPLTLQLQEWKHPTTGDRRYVAHLTFVPGSAPYRAKEGENEYSLIAPVGTAATPQAFLQYDAGAQMVWTVNRGHELTATADVPAPHGLSLTLDYSATTEEEFRLTFDKPEKGQVNRTLWPRARQFFKFSDAP